MEQSTDYYEQLQQLKQTDHAPSLIESSEYVILYPSNRETYFKQALPSIQKLFNQHGLSVDLDVEEGTVTVKTTKKTKDYYIIIKARDMLKLVARYVPLEHAMKVLEDDVYSELVKIKNLTKKKEIYIKRRQRLVGPNGNTLKALELLTDCYMLVNGGTVAIIGNLKGVEKLSEIVTDCMLNIHPIYHIKKLMIVKQLEKDDKLKNESWNRFLPKFAKLHNKNKRNKDGKKKEKKKYTPFPPPQQPRKVDLQLESGEYHMSVKQKDETKSKKQKVDVKSKSKRLEKIKKQYEAPEEE